MQGALAFSLSALIGCSLGLYTAIHSVKSGYFPDSPEQSGYWEFWEKAGTPLEDVYTRAHFVAAGRLVLNAREVAEYNTQYDSEGSSLSGKCTYRFVSHLPRSAWYSLWVQGADGSTVAGLTSFEMLQSSHQKIQVTFSPNAVPGHWLDTSSASDYRVFLRLYSPDSQRDHAMFSLTIPPLKKEGCL